MSESEDKKLGVLFKKVLSSGISAALGAEDTVKNLLHDLPIPKEIINGLLENAKNAKTDFITAIKMELRDYLNKVDITEEIDKVLKKYDFEIEAKIKVNPKKSKKPKTTK